MGRFLKARVAMLTVLAFLALLAPFATQAAVPVTYTSFSGTLTSTGYTQALPLYAGGFSTCSLVVSGTSTGVTATAQVATDSPGASNTATYVTATTLGSSGVVSANGTYTGNVSSIGLTWFRVQVSAISGGSWNYFEACSTASGGGAVTQSTSPWVVTTPAPAPTCSPSAAKAICVQNVRLGSGSAAWYQTVPDAIASTAPITTATTTQVIAAQSGQSIYIFWAGVQATSAESAAAFDYEYSPTANCTSGNTTLTPLGKQTAPTTGNALTSLIAGSTLANVAGGFSPAYAPYIIPPNNYLCLVTSGTTISLQGLVWYAQR
jgi:hypothetical protein